MRDLLSTSASEIARRIRDRELSAVEVTETFIGRIQEVNPRLNAVVVDRFDAAMDEAREVDRRGPADPDVQPLAGVPCTIKEFFGVEDMPWTAGIRARAGERAPRDATVVRRLRDAGAIVLGLTNAPEGGLWFETNNPIYGRSSNPWDLHRTPGGSSGGEGAILAAGGSAFGMGSDTGGSIRIPAALCGISGHKPTGGMVPATGHFPHAPTGDLPVMSCGPMARDVRDLPLLMRVISGPDGEDPQTTDAWALGDPEGIDLREISVFPVPSNGRAMVRAPIRAAVIEAAEALVDAGATRRELHAPDLGRSFEVWGALLSELSDSYDEICGADEPISLVRELAKYPFGRSSHAASVLLILGLERALARLPGQTRSLAEVALRLRAQLEAALGPNGVLIHPVCARTAPRHRGMLLQSPFDSSLTTAFNITTLPSTVVPIRLDPKGLPIGVQIVARRGNDHLTLAVGAALQEQFGMFTPVEPRFGRRPLLPLARGLAQSA